MARTRHPGLRALALTALIGASACATRAPVSGPYPAPVSPASPGAAASDPAASALVATAVALVGTAYHPGGQAPSQGFDCSGLVLWVFGQHGVRVPRTVADLFAAGDRLRPGMMPGAGDLVFFDTEGRGPSHVGIALGNGSFVHAPSRRGVVRVESLASPYWVERYLGARRLLSEDRRRAGR